MTLSLIVTCEHGGYEIPPAYRPQFHAIRNILRTHRGWDAGALPLARQLSTSFDAPLVFSTTSRLLVDLNRSVSHPRLFSEWSRKLPERDREEMLEQVYVPYRNEVIHTIQPLMTGRRSVLHLSVHTFTPELDGKRRMTDVGLLYDPQRLPEKQFANCWKASLESCLPAGMKIHRNQPYRGVSDGLVTALRRQFSSGNYLGIELEVSQKLIRRKQSFSRHLQQQIVRSLRLALDSFESGVGNPG